MSYARATNRLLPFFRRGRMRQYGKLFELKSSLAEQRKFGASHHRMAAGTDHNYLSAPNYSREWEHSNLKDSGTANETAPYESIHAGSQ